MNGRQGGRQVRNRQVAEMEEPRKACVVEASVKCVYGGMGGVVQNESRKTAAVV